MIMQKEMFPIVHEHLNRERAFNQQDEIMIEIAVQKVSLLSATLVRNLADL